MLVVEGLEKRYGAIRALAGLDLSVSAGELLSVLGPSGSGKSTALRVIAGLELPDSGRVSIAGREVTHAAPGARDLAMVFQSFALFPHLTVAQNIGFGLAARRTPAPERERRVQEAGEALGIGALLGRRPSALSGGERQRVALARALARNPDVLLLDEPLAALDVRTRANAARTLTAVLRESPAPALLVTHDFHEAAQLGQRVGVIDSGRVVQEGTPAELAASPSSAFVADFAGAVVLTGSASRGPDGLTVVELDGGGRVLSTDTREGPVAASVFPWEIAVGPPDGDDPSSQQNHLQAEVVSVTTVGNRVRLGLACPQPLSAEVTQTSGRALALEPGARVTASWKAAATRLVAL